MEGSSRRHAEEEEVPVPVDAILFDLDGTVSLLSVPGSDGLGAAAS